MAIFKKNKKEETKKVSTQEDNELKDEISKAYDEIMSGNKEEKARLLESGISGRRRGALRADHAPWLVRR